MTLLRPPPPPGGHYIWNHNSINCPLDCVCHDHYGARLYWKGGTFRHLHRYVGATRRYTICWFTGSQVETLWHMSGGITPIDADVIHQQHTFILHDNRDSGVPVKHRHAPTPCGATSPSQIQGFLLGHTILGTPNSHTYVDWWELSTSQQSYALY